MIGLPTSVTSRISPRCDPGLARGFADQRVHRLAHHARQLLVAARVHHHVGNAAHQVFAEADLRVHRPDRGDDLAAREIGEVGGDGGGADIDRDAEGALGEARHDGDDVAAFAQRDGDLPLPRAQRLLQAGKRREIDVRFVEIPLLVQSLLKATKIARRLVHVRLADLDVIEADDRIDLDRMRLRALADDLPMNLAFGRHVDDEVAANSGLAAEPPAGGERSALRGVAGLDLCRRRHMIGAGTDGVLGEVALRDVDLTAAANATPATDRIEIDAERARGFEQARAFGELAALAGGREDDAMGHRVMPAKAGIQRKPRCPVRKTLDSLDPRFRGGDTCAMRGRRATRASRRVLAPVVLGQNGQAMRIVFVFQPLGGGRASSSRSSPQGTGSPRRHSARYASSLLAPACIAAASIARMKRSDNWRLADARPAFTMTWLGMSRQ